MKLFWNFYYFEILWNVLKFLKIFEIFWKFWNMKFYEFFEICFQILGNFLKFWKMQSGSTRLIPSMAEINEWFSEVNTCFSKSKRDFKEDYVTISWPIRMVK